MQTADCVKRGREGMSPRTIKQTTITLRDVARATGLSPATVSIVLNAAPLARYIPARTKERIEKAARRLGYRPNQLARSLRSSRNHTLGVMVFDITDPYCTPIVRGIENSLYQASFVPILADAHNDRGRFERYLEMLLDRLQWQGCDVSTIRSVCKVINEHDFFPAIYLHALDATPGSAFYAVGMLCDRGDLVGRSFNGVPVLGSAEDLEQVLVDLETFFASLDEVERLAAPLRAAGAEQGTQEEPTPDLSRGPLDVGRLGVACGLVAVEEGGQRPSRGVSVHERRC